MKITIDKDLVELSPENDHETKDLEALWRLTVDCAGFNKKIVPVGEYIPGKIPAPASSLRACPQTLRKHLLKSGSTGTVPATANSATNIST